MIYFDNASTTLPKPPQVIKAAAEAMALGNPSRGAHGAAMDSLRLMFETRALISDLFNVGNPLRVAFTSGATLALNIAIGGIEGHIITTAAEHNSVLRPLNRRGNYSVVPLDCLGRLEIGKLVHAIKHDTEAVIMTHASNLVGNIFDIAAVGEICKKRGLLFVVDAAQTAGLIPVDMTACGIDALCVSGHKSLFAPQGIGAICLSERFSPKPLIVGGSGLDTFSLVHPLSMPDALEAGTQNISGIAGLNAGIKYVRALGKQIFDEPDRLAKRFVEGLKAFGRKITLYGDIENKKRLPVVALNIDGMDSAEVAAILFERHGICVRAGGHCAPLMHETLGTKNTGAVRFSFSHFNTEKEIDLALAALGELSS